ncbi:MAG: hypothetical protein LBU70_11010, partial [Chitinispirillales bacterium]|nr:hypothetical protein [Chitinispirillales bacterium]
FTGTKKCGVEKIAQRALARLQFFGAQNARTGHFAVTVCYVLFAPFATFLINFYFDYFSNLSFSFLYKFSMLLSPSLSRNKQKGRLSVSLCFITQAQHFL